MVSWEVAEVVQTVAWSLHQVESSLWAICSLGMEGGTPLELRLEETLGEVVLLGFGLGMRGSFGDQTQPAEQLGHHCFLFPPKAFHWCLIPALAGCSPQVLVWLGLGWATYADVKIRQSFHHRAHLWGAHQGRG